MYLYHILFTLINISGIDCQKKNSTLSRLNVDASFRQEDWSGATGDIIHD
jgi:hypothetical protein